MRPETPRPTTARTALHRRYLPVPNTPVEPTRGSWPKLQDGLYPGEPETCRRSLRAFLPIWLHLSLLLGILKAYRIEGRALLILAAIATISFPIHYWVPLRWKKPLFLGISILGLFSVFGAEASGIVLGLGSTLVALARLPIAWWQRVALMSLTAIALASLRILGAEHDLVETVGPILGSMFMFRMIVYLYELKHAKERESLIDALGYFFLLPNYCFLHFPVVDYRTLLRGYYARDQQSIQVAGLRMLFKGMMQLLAYKLVYHRLMIPVEDVNTLRELSTYIVANYLLYLQVSGQFHIACGMLHLFGYQLPSTHHNYLLADGFTDYWRRINIYWKDFMIRVVFNPIAFRLKRKPAWLSLSAATLTVFVVTWFLHAYQSFWIRGTWGFTVPDALFWGILGTLVLVNVQFDARRPPASAKRSAPTWPGLAWQGARVGLTFATIAVLWSLWSSPSLSAWLGMIRRAVA